MKLQYPKDLWVVKNNWTIYSNLHNKALKEGFLLATITALKMKFSIKDFFSKCDQIRSFQ